MPPCLAHPPTPACSVAIDQLCVHECHIIGKGGMYWPQPTFKVRQGQGKGASHHTQQLAVTAIDPASRTPHPALLQVVALDRPDEPLIAKSCTGCWTGVSTPGRLARCLPAAVPARLLLHASRCMLCEGSTPPYDRLSNISYPLLTA